MAVLGRLSMVMSRSGCCSCSGNGGGARGARSKSRRGQRTSAPVTDFNGRRKLLRRRATQEDDAATSGQGGELPAAETAGGRRGAVLAMVSAKGVVESAMANAEEIPPGEQTVVVAGASGKTGTQVVRALLSRGYNVVAGVRNPSRYVDPQPSTPTDPQGAEPPALGLQDVVLQEQADGGGRLRVERLDVTSGVAELASLLGKTNASFVVCATGFRPSAQTLLGIQDTPKLVDNIGTSNLVDACLANRDRVKGFVLVSSLLTNAPAVGEASNPNYLFLNLLGGVLDEKKAGEDYLRKSGLPWVIVRPGGLSDEPAASLGGLIVRPEDTLFGRDTDPGRVISREQVGIVCADAVAALGGAFEGNDDVAFSNRVVEVVQAR